MNETMNVFTPDPDTVYAKIVKRDDGYHVIDFDGTEGPVCNKRTSDGYIILTPNQSNRKCYNEKNAEKFFADGGDHIDLYYKAARVYDPNKKVIPNEKLIRYLPEDLQAEYMAIVNRTVEARKEAVLAAKTARKPMTDIEKAQAKLAKAQAALAKLQAQND